MYSNTTLVKVKLGRSNSSKQTLDNSNTTLVKVKLKHLIHLFLEHNSFKYNTC